VLALAALIAFLLAQFAATRLAPHEPYPAVLMPGFGAAPEADGSFSFVVRSAEIHYADADPVTVTPEQLFEGFASNQMNPTWDRVLGDPGDLERDAEAMDWLRERATALSVNITSVPTDLSVCWIDTEIEIDDGAVAPAPCETTDIKL
jgi:hypothetical protein